MAVDTGRPDTPSTPPPPPATAAPRGDSARGSGFMGESLSLGRVAGIPVGVNWSMLLVFWLVVWSLAGQLLPDAAPDQPAAAYWGVALFAGLLFYVSLLAHEVSHALVARRRGVVVEGITLWLFGGVAKLKGEAGTAGAELRIAIVGPLTSLAIAVVFGLLGLLLTATGAPALVVALPVWLSLVNAMLAVFNVVPAFPLDGGRVLRAYLWRRRGDKLSATRSAARAGSAFGWLLIAGGVLELFTTASIGGLWFMFLGWFLLTAARAESTQSIMRDALRGVRIAEVMTADPVVAPDWVVLQEFLDSYALRHHHTTFPVRDFDGRITGMVSLAQVRMVPPERRLAVRVRDVQVPLSAVPLVRADELLTELLQRMNAYTVTRALVFDAERLVGIVTPADVTRMMMIAESRRP